MTVLATGLYVICQMTRERNGGNRQPERFKERIIIIGKRFTELNNVLIVGYHNSFVDFFFYTDAGIHQKHHPL